MKTILHKAETRGHANYGWLDTYYTFSFANYYNPERVHFGALRVINDDTIAGGMGFSKHPHRDMEIISIPIEGDLRHGDSMGNQGIISKGEIQVMSAGTGIMHSEKNGNSNKPVKLFQIWVVPNKMNVEPRYAQMEIASETKPNDFQQIVSPNPDDAGLWIHQNAWFNLANFTAGNAKEYRLHNASNGVYVFVISGQAKIGDQVLDARDGLGITETEVFTLEATTDSQILLMEVPMLEL